MADRAGKIPGAVGPQADGIFMGHQSCRTTGRWYFYGASEALGCVQRSGKVIRTSAHFRQPRTICTALSVF